MLWMEKGGSTKYPYACIIREKTLLILIKRLKISESVFLNIDW